MTPNHSLKRTRNGRLHWPLEELLLPLDILIVLSSRKDFWDPFRGRDGSPRTLLLLNP